jgi:serine/threonine protein kinase
VFGKLMQMFGGAARVDVKKRFEILGKSGMGSMSQVFRARDKELGRVVCLKVCDKEKTAKFEARFAGLKRPSEGEIATSLKHPHIVQTHEFGLTTNDEPYLVSEWVDGPGLHGLIEGGNTQLNGNRVNYLAQAAEGLAYIHQQKYLHRDICPRNFLIASGNKLKFIDFGLTVPYTPDFCKPGNRTGTAEYLAPEIIKRSSTDHRVDVFALGVTAYELFTGNLPWGKTESVETLLRHMSQPPKDPREHVPDLDDATKQFLLKAVEREPAKRFATAQAFRDAVQKLPRKW